MVQETVELGSSCVCRLDNGTKATLTVVNQNLSFTQPRAINPINVNIALTRSSTGFSFATERSQTTTNTVFGAGTGANTVFGAGTGTNTLWKYYAIDGSLYIHLRHLNESWYALILPQLMTGQLIDAATYQKHLNGGVNVKSVPKRAPHNLSEVRKMSDDVDFHIECLDGVRIPVHSLILKTYWPFFKAMMQNDCVESNDKVLKLDYPADWVEVLVSFIYGQDVKMDFEQATGLLIVAEMYQLPKLVEMATEEIMSSSSSNDSISLEDALTGWKRAFEAHNDQVTAFLAGKVAAKQSQFGQSDEEKAVFAQLSTEEALGLYFDTLKISTLKK